jgi:hypothetical protein
MQVEARISQWKRKVHKVFSVHILKNHLIKALTVALKDKTLVKWQWQKQSLLQKEYC